MGNNDFNISITTKISADEAIKKISRIPEWWRVTFTGSAEKQNDTFTARMSGDSFFNFTVTELIPGKRVVWLVTDCNLPWYPDKKEWKGTRLIFDLREKGGETTLHFRHEGLTPDVECYKDCELGWTHFIKTSLYFFFTTGKGVLQMPKVTFGNHLSVIVPRKDREGVCKFYCDVLGGTLVKAEGDKDIIRLGTDTFLVFLYGDVPDASEFLRTARAFWLELKSDNVEEMKMKILGAGVMKLDVPDPHLYFQAPGGQCWRLVGTNEDLSFYEGVGDGPNVANIKKGAEKGFGK